jgi:PKD repeat protein
MKMSNHLKLSAALLGLLALTSCKPGGIAQSDLNSSSSFSGLSNCQSGGASLDQAQINGTNAVVSGQDANLSLANGVDCNQANSATWKTSGVTLGQGSQISAKIKGSGIYVIEVSSTAQSQNAVQSKVLHTNIAMTSARIAVTDSTVLFVGPQIGNEFTNYDFSLAVPTSIQLQSADWNFNDGSAVVSSIGIVSHAFSVGAYDIVVTALDSNNQSITLNHHIEILPLTSGIDCPIQNLDIVGPTEVSIETRNTFSLSEMSCLNYSGTQISWDFGDGSAPMTTTSVQHTYDVAGNYTVTATVRLGSSDANTLTLTRQVKAVNYLEVMPGPVPTPTPVDPKACSDVGQTRTIEGANSTQNAMCGNNGNRTDNYRDFS